MPKSEMKAKRSSSVKNPFTDLTNANKKPTKKPVLKSNHNINKEKYPLFVDKENEEKMDGLILLHSHLSSLILQVDELVAKVLKAPSKIGRNEIESLTQVLLDMQSSLEPWPLRFQKALSSHSNVSEDHLNQSVVSENVDAAEDTTDVQSPEGIKIDSIISPSPLVAWRGESNVNGGGRQLFLLTPLPRSKALPSSRRGYLKSAFEKFKSDNGFQSLLGLSNYSNDDLLEGGDIKPTTAQVSDFTESMRESTMESEIASPPNIFKKDYCSVLVSTPCMKMSPPKSCVLLEPISELNDKTNAGVRKSTPFPLGLQGLSESESSELSSEGAPEDLSLKYPELFGIQPIHKLGNGKKGLDSSPDWFMSPPKSCVLMEPSDDKLLTDAIKNFKLSRTACESDQSKIAPSERRGDGKSFGDRFAIVESTPMFKEPESSYRAGNTVKKGENTLKKELWTKFEEASISDVRFDASVRETAQKGFLDRLDEVSVDKTKSGN